MDFDLTEEHRLFADTTRRFFTEQCDLVTVRALAESEYGYEPGWWRSAAELGWLALLVDEEAGGLGLEGEGVRYLGLVAEEFGRAVAPGPLVPSSIVAETLSRSGSARQRGEVLAGLVTGEAVAAWCFAEGGQRWSADAVAMRARNDGSGYRLSGCKRPVEAAIGADHFLVTALAGEGPCQFLVSAQTPGIKVVPYHGLDLVRRYAQVEFDDVALDSEALVGVPGEVDEDIERQLQLALALNAVESAGAADRVFEFTLEWCFERYSFGRPLASYQALKHRFADMKSWLENSHATASAALSAIAEQSNESDRLARVAKAYVSDRLPALVQDCVQMHGGLGVTWEHDIHLFLRRVASNSKMFGDPCEHYAGIADLLGV